MPEWFFNGRFLSQEMTGVQRFAAEIIKALDELIGKQQINNETHRFTLLAPQNTKKIPDFKNISICYALSIS